MLFGAALFAVSALAGGATADAGPVRPALAVIPGHLAIPQGPAVQILGNEPGLESVYCTSTTNCWAAGAADQGSALINEIVHWTGQKWSRVAVPNPGGTGKGAENTLNSVRCASAKNCWAVGVYARKDTDFAEILHWTGKKWFAVAAPTPGGTLAGSLNDLLDVACTSITSCWATGEYGTVAGSSQVILDLALHWNGKTWSQVHTPNPGGTGNNHVNALIAVRCAGPKDCWAVGTGAILGNTIIFRDEALHWDGQKWSMALVPNPAGIAAGDFNELAGLSCTSTSNCWATGSYGHVTRRSLNLALHWNGHTWSKVSVANPGGTTTGASNILAGISCNAPKDCWAAGSFANGALGVPIQNEIFHWDGTTWKKASVPQPGGTATGDLSELNNVRCASKINCWAVGDQMRKGGPDLRQILHWTGGQWVTS